jgi:hypothetical protein
MRLGSSGSLSEPFFHLRMRIERRDDDITVQNKEVMISVKTVRGSINWSGDVTTWLKTYVRRKSLRHSS